MPVSAPVLVTPVMRRRTTTTHAPTAPGIAPTALSITPTAPGIKIKKIDAYFEIIQISAKNEHKGPAAEQEDNENYRWNLRFPKGSHCIKGRRSGV